MSRRREIWLVELFGNPIHRQSAGSHIEFHHRPGTPRCWLLRRTLARTRCALRIRRTPAVKVFNPAVANLPPLDSYYTFPLSLSHRFGVPS